MPTASSSSAATPASCAPTSRSPCPTRATARARPSPSSSTTSTKSSPSPARSRPPCPTAPTGATVKTEPRTPHYQELPHARPGGIAGLLELLLDHHGKDDIYRLADDLAFEIDDLLPIVDAARLLGFLTVNEGDAAITATGADFANSEILHQKELFRKAAVDNVLLLRQIVRAIEAKSDRSVSEDFFHDLLDEQFSEEETQRQLETAISWGRYAELFDFDAARRRFIQPEKLPAESDATSTAEIDA